jgi:hypothetical protein
MANTCHLFRLFHPSTPPHPSSCLFTPLIIHPSTYQFIEPIRWDVVFTPHYTASFLVDELRPFPAVFGPLIEAQIPLNPIPGENVWNGKKVELR